MVYEEITNGSTVDKLVYNYGDNGLVGFTLNGTEYFYIRNSQTDIIGILDSNGTQVVSYTYDTWGKLISITGDKALGEKNPYRYRGYRYDSETGYYYLQSRYYNPEWGRFLNADGLVSTGQGFIGYNMFAYCLNSPVNRRDDNGLRSGCITEGATSSSAISYKSSQDYIGAAAAAYGGYFGGKSALGGVRVVKNGTKAHRGKVMTYGPGKTDKFIPKSSYVLDEAIDGFKGSFNLKGKGFKGAAKGIVAVGMIANGVNNYTEYDGNIKHAAIGWSVDTLADIAIGTATAALIAIGVAYLGITAPLWGTALLAASISYGASSLLENKITNLKNSVISGF
ncbi:hypothetical protein GCM10008908_28960 [Clostridium subterminale]|uniref:RHS repeat-associated core domain-containing protein n=1 Tax=Clostridium subterminale TaxID=1550 RepID=A0ABN1KU87_CLOSU